MIFSSKIIEDAVNNFSKIPGIGKKTALRMVLHLLNSGTDQMQQLEQAIENLRNNIFYCKECNNIADKDLCSICTDSYRDGSIICIVENIRDIVSIESTKQFNGVYHVLGALLSPLEGVGPEQLFLETLKERIQKNNTKEIILALSSNIEGDTTSYYISKLIQNEKVTISSLARGVAFGSELEYTDELTLSRAISKRLPLEVYLKTEG